MEPPFSKNSRQDEGVPIPSATGPIEQASYRDRLFGDRPRNETPADQQPTPPASTIPSTTPRGRAQRGGGGRGSSTRGSSSIGATTSRHGNRVTLARSSPPVQEEDEDEDEELDVTKLSPVQQRQRQAHSALRQLRPRPNQEVSIFAQKWTPEHKEILESNVKLLLDATKDTSDESLASESRNGDGDVVGGGAAQLSGDAEQRRRQSTPGRGQKRRREDEEEEETSNEAGETTTIRPWKKLRLSTASRAEIQPEDLAELQPQPLQLQFPSHPLEDRSDQWYILEFRKLYRRMERFVDEYFCIHDLEEDDFYQPWAINHTPEFLAYVEEVAEADPVNGSWDSLLRDVRQRKWLIMGVLMRILQKKVFDEDLWGADIAEKNLLLAAEKAFCITSEGFRRTKLRSEIVHTIVDGRPITTHFHTDVARLTAQVSLLLKPLTDYLYTITPPDGTTIPLVWDQYQGLHNIISCAAYLSICIRLSPTIFQFVEVSTNEPWNDEEQHDLETALYQKNKEHVIAAHKTAIEAHQATKAVLEKKVAEFAAAGRTGSRAGSRAASRLVGHLETQPRYLNHTHRSLAKISVWPNITRYKPGSDDEDDQSLPLDQRNGMRVFKVSKSAVLSYYGVENRVERWGRRVGLKKFAREKNTLCGFPPERRELWVVAAAAVVAVPAWILAEKFSRGWTGEDLGTTLMGLAGNLVEMVR